jgi:hypothetical protein
MVPMMLGPALLLALTARHVDGPAQAIPSNVPTLGGTVSFLHVLPPSVVPMMTGLPKMPNPTAVHDEVLTHAMPVSPSTSAGTFCTFQLPPSFVDAMIESELTA